MLGCRKIRGLIAASAYEELAESERRALERHLPHCPACRAEADMLAKVAARIPRTSPEPGVDLLPRVRARLAEREAPRGVPAWQWTAFATAALVLVCVGTLTTLSRSAGPVAPPMSPVASAQEQAQDLLKSGNYTQAYDLLSGTVAAHATDPTAGRAQAMLANLAFERHWYDRADEAYMKLMTAYPATVDEASPAERAAIVERWNILEEGRKNRYALLYALDRARNDRSGAFEVYEGVVAQAPDSFVAQQAVREMVALVAADSPANSPQDVVTAMQTVRSRCKHPITVAKLDLEIGLTAWRDLKDVTLAVDALQKAEKSSEPVLAQRAREALTEIETRNPS